MDGNEKFRAGKAIAEIVGICKAHRRAKENDWCSECPFYEYIGCKFMDFHPERGE